MEHPKRRTYYDRKHVSPEKNLEAARLMAKSDSAETLIKRVHAAFGYTPEGSPNSYSWLPSIERRPDNEGTKRHYMEHGIYIVQSIKVIRDNTVLFELHFIATKE